MKNENLISEVILTLKNAHYDPRQERGRKNSTLAFYENLQLLGEKYEFKTYHGRRKGGGEWLWDFVWSNEGNGKINGWKKLSHLELVCESEWDMYFDALLMDFQKLMVVKAKIKLFICQGCKKHECASNEDLFKKLSNRIGDNFISTDESWILFISDDNDKPSCWVWTYNDTNKIIPFFNNSFEYVW